MNMKQLEAHLKMMFGGLNGWIALRGLPEQNNGIYNKWVHSQDPQLTNKVTAFIDECANRRLLCSVVPAVFKTNTNATSANLASTKVILVDIDNGNTNKKLQQLSDSIGKPTMVVASGGTTQTDHQKIHVYYELEEPANNEWLTHVFKLRTDLAQKIGADEHFKSGHQPIRLVSSIHWKTGEAITVKTLEHNNISFDNEAVAFAINDMESTTDSPANSTAPPLLSLTPTL